MSSVRRFLEMIRFSHTLFALPFALLSATLAWHKKGSFAWTELAGILVCMVFARSAAMGFNRLADRAIDAANPRTATRHLPAGLLSAPAVWAFTIGCAAAFIAGTFLFYLAEPPNPWPSYLSVPVLLFVGAYSYTKRFTELAHFWLGAALLLAPLAAWIAILGVADLAVPATLGLAVFFWVAGFDIIYACQDADFDRQARLRSIPARLGVARALRVALGCHVVMIAVLIVLHALASPPLGWLYLAAVAGTGGLIIYQHILVRPNDLTRVNQAFFQVNAVISVGLLVVVLVDVILAGRTAGPGDDLDIGVSRSKLREGTMANPQDTFPFEHPAAEKVRDMMLPLLNVRDDKDYRKLSRRDKYLFLVFSFETQVMNGGIDQYFRNSTGNSALQCLEALRAIGANQSHRLLKEACDLFPGGQPSTDQEERRRQMRQITGDKDLGDLLQGEYTLESDLYQLLLDYYEKADPALK